MGTFKKKPGFNRLLKTQQACASKLFLDNLTAVFVAGINRLPEKIAVNQLKPAQPDVLFVS